MGGSIGVTIREENGIIHKMCRWTNSLPDFFKSIQFIEKDVDYLQKYLSTWYEMVKEYKDHIDGVKPLPKITMVDVYAPYPFFAPMEYGLVVIDYQNNKVYSAQGYSSFVSKINNAMIIQDLKHKEDKQFWKELCEKKLLIFEKYYKANNNDENYEGEIVNQQISFEELADLLNKNRTEKNYLQFKINVEPWEFIRFEETLKGFTEFKEKLLSEGFDFSDEDEKNWSDYFLILTEREKEIEKESQN